MNTELFLQRFNAFIQSEQLIGRDETFLLAVSGGIDSMVMAWAFHQAGYPFQIAHCNFGLRDRESDADEELVRQQAQAYGVKVHVRRFETKKYAKVKGISTQMAARDLRYTWFEGIRVTEKLAGTALAQHAGDLAETMLINLARGTGIAGLHGIQAKKKTLIRPLLFLTKQEIVAQAALNAIPYREDASNASTDYTRNKIRLEIIPVLREINPSLEQTFLENAGRLASVERIYQLQIARYRAELLEQQPSGSLKIRIDKLGMLGADTRYVLYELITEFGFSDALCGQIIEGLGRQAGKSYLSSTHILVRDRDYLLLEPLSKGQQQAPNFSALFKVDFPGNVMHLDRENEFIAYFDASFAALPLEVRYWQEGDSFYPLGMKSRKKLSDFFTDNKIPLPLKQQIPLVLHKGQIIWVVGYRIDERFKVTAHTDKILRLTYLSHAGNVTKKTQ